MISILEETQKEHARPTEGVRFEMLQAWGRNTGPSGRPTKAPNAKRIA